MADNPRTVQELIDRIKKYGLESIGCYYGKYRGFVVDNKDPEKLGRVKLQVPQVAGDKTIEYWAWGTNQPAGDDFGDFFIPPKGAGVWVEFEGGNPSFPTYGGGHWAKKKATVPSEAKRAEPTNAVRKTKNLVFEMDDENSRIKMSNKSSGKHVALDGNDFKSDVGSVDHKASGSYSETISGAKSSTSASSSETTGAKSTTATTVGLTAASALITIAGQTMTWDSGGMAFGFAGHTIELRPDGVYIEGIRFLDHMHTGVTTGGGSTGGVV